MYSCIYGREGIFHKELKLNLVASRRNSEQYAGRIYFIHIWDYTSKVISKCETYV